ncbi:MAG: hypothetical protein ACUVQ1_08310 [Candidatus Kapaibacteriales bacterium]
MMTIIFNFLSRSDNIIIANLINKLLSGLLKGGSETECLDINSLKIDECRACTSDLFFSQNGSCVCQDDLTQYYLLISNSHNLIFIVKSTDLNSLNSFYNLLNRFEPFFPYYFDGKNSKSIKNVLGLFFIDKSMSNYYRFFINALNDFSLLFQYNFLGIIQIRNIEILSVFSEQSISKLGVYEDIEQIGYDLAKNNSLNNEIKKKIENLTYFEKNRRLSSKT